MKTTNQAAGFTPIQMHSIALAVAQKALEYFGFEGNYDNDLKTPGHCDEYGVITYNSVAFEKGFDYLNTVAAEEMYHSRDVLKGNYRDVNWNDHFQKVMAQSQGEYKANMFLYRRQGLFKGVSSNFLVERISRYGNMLGKFDNYPLEQQYFHKRWWHNIYKTPRKW